MTQFSAHRDLFEGYLKRDSKLADFFGLFPGEWDAALEQRSLHPTASWAPEELAELQQWNESMGNSAAALENIGRLGQPGTYVVATGQQAGLLAGPLYTIYKSLTAVKLARELASSRGVTVVPVFWVASEDHDFDEVRTVSWIGRDGELASFRYEPENYQPGISVFDIPVEPSLKQLLQRFEAETFPSEFKDDLLQTLHRTIEMSANLEELFCRLLLCLMKQYGLVLVSPRLRCVREKGKSLFERELQTPGESSARILQTSQAMQQLGYHTTLHREPDDLNCFIYRDHLRCKVKWKHDAVLLLHPFTGDEMETMTQEQALELLASSPWRFSTNVVTRSIVQDAIFPTVAYVAGPGEIAYFPLLRECYGFFHVFMPVIYPRLRVTLIEPRVQHALERLGISVQEFLSLSADKIYRRALAAQNGGRHERLLQKSQQDMLGLVSELRRQLASDDPAVLSSFEKMEQNVRTSFDRLTERYFNALKKEDRTLRAYVTKADHALRPTGKEQERVLNPYISFLQNYGWQFIQWLDDSLTLNPSVVQYLFLSTLHGCSGGKSSL